MRAGAAFALVLLLAPQVSPVDTARADLQRRRDEVIRAYNLDAERPRLDGYVRIIIRALRDPSIVRQPPVSRVPFAADSRREFLERAAAFVADRLGVRLAGVNVRFSHLPEDKAGRVNLVDDRATVDIDELYRNDDEAIVAVLTHEFAHIVLKAPGSGVAAADADDEDLADATVVMAGLGPLMLRASYREEVTSSGNKAEWTVRRTGSLHPVAIAYLTLVQAEMAGFDADSRRSLIGGWLEPAWSTRAGGPRK